jgi:sec-independent protein translocase protein TatA
MDLGWPEILIIAAVILVLFGSKKLPDAARSVGRSMRILKSEVKGMHEDEAAARPSAPQQLPAAPAVATPTEQTQPAAAGVESPDVH